MWARFNHTSGASRHVADHPVKLARLDSAELIVTRAWTASTSSRMCETDGLIRTCCQRDDRARDPGRHAGLRTCRPSRSSHHLRRSATKPLNHEGSPQCGYVALLHLSDRCNQQRPSFPHIPSNHYSPDLSATSMKPTVQDSRGVRRQGEQQGCHPKGRSPPGEAGLSDMTKTRSRIRHETRARHANFDRLCGEYAGLDGAAAGNWNGTSGPSCCKIDSRPCSSKE